MVHALIIDDNVDNVTVLASLLAAEKVTCTTVNDPLQVKALIGKLEHVDIIFLDLEMPGLNGYELLHTLREHLTVPIVACTVHVSEINSAYENGFDGFLAKPLKQNKFAVQLRQILNGEAVWDIR